MILNWVEVSPPAQTSTFAPAQWAPVLLDDPFVDWRRRKPYGLPLLPKNQVRAIGYRATLCFHCAMTALDLEARGWHACRVSLRMLRRLRGWRGVRRHGPVHAGRWARGGLTMREQEDLLGELHYRGSDDDCRPRSPTKSRSVGNAPAGSFRRLNYTWD